ncbi:putative nuclease HARBI1 [Photinus pyralis]|uniref:putative nuclease HARBI1 n=1 Tax=Photinus pyralis TaxID=7054 RepID=UPI0012670062|nr:putative nuclease HARBI1 [Photinus pyralis]
MEGFKKKKSFPGVLGAIDGCHIDIKAPKESSVMYVNRKGRPSIILQAVCDHNCSFTDCFIGFPGSVHDARVFSKSGMQERCNNDQFFPNDSHILGDSAYPLSQHVLVPYKDNGHLTRKQTKFNVIHASTRVTIERAFGLLKGRWRRLNYLELHCSAHIPSTIMAACVLHNFCIKNKDEISFDVHPGGNNAQDITSDATTTKGGVVKRCQIAETLWHI